MIFAAHLIYRQFVGDKANTLKRGGKQHAYTKTKLSGDTAAWKARVPVQLIDHVPDDPQ